MWEHLTAVRDLGRVHDIASILVHYGFGDMVRRLGLGAVVARAGKVLPLSQLSESAALPAPVRVRRALEDMGPTFVKLGQVLAIAERLDTLAGGFAAGLRPTGNKDPFALRRNALGLARTLLEGGHDVVLHELVEAAVALQPTTHPELGALDITQFVYDRLRGYYTEQGVSAAQFEAVYNAVHESLPDFDARLRAIGEFSKLPEAAALAAANKRSRNILRKVEGAVPTTIDAALLTEPAERELAAAMDAAVADTDALLDSRDYVAVLGRLARLRPQVDAFFDAVMVNADDMAVRNNRLALLQRLSDRLGSVAAIEQLAI